MFDNDELVKGTAMNGLINIGKSVIEVAANNSQSRLLSMNIIAAMDANQGIGKDNRLPWHLPREYAHFVRETTRTADPAKRNAVLMGRKCWESIPQKYKPLKGRLNIVLSRTMEPLISHPLIVAKEFDEVLSILESDARFKDTIETIWNVGGHDIYALGLAHPSLHKLVLTRLDRDFQCDVRFPEVNWTLFEQNADFDGTEEERGIVWRVTSYTRRGIKSEGLKKQTLDDEIIDEIDDEDEMMMRWIEDDISKQIGDDISKQIGDDISKQIGDDISKEISDDIAKSIRNHKWTNPNGHSGLSTGHNGI